MTKLYRIVDWDSHFENNRTRELKHMAWVPLPNKHDGDGYTVLIEGERGVEDFAAWVLIVEVASKCEPRGTLIRANGEPHTPETLARMTRAPAAIFANALKRLSNGEIGWMEITPQEGATIPHPAAKKERKKERKRKKRKKAPSRRSPKGEAAGGPAPFGQITKGKSPASVVPVKAPASGSASGDGY